MKQYQTKSFLWYMPIPNNESNSTNNGNTIGSSTAMYQITPHIYQFVIGFILHFISCPFSGLGYIC